MQVTRAGSIGTLTSPSSVKLDSLREVLLGLWDKAGVVTNPIAASAIKDEKGVRNAL